MRDVSLAIGKAVVQTGKITRERSAEKPAQRAPRPSGPLRFRVPYSRKISCQRYGRAERPSLGVADFARHCGAHYDLQVAGFVAGLMGVCDWFARDLK